MVNNNTLNFPNNNSNNRFLSPINPSLLFIPSKKRINNASFNILNNSSMLRINPILKHCWRQTFNKSVNEDLAPLTISQYFKNNSPCNILSYKKINPFKSKSINDIKSENISSTPSYSYKYESPFLKPNRAENIIIRKVPIKSIPFTDFIQVKDFELKDKVTKKLFKSEFNKKLVEKSSNKTRMYKNNILKKFLKDNIRSLNVIGTPKAKLFFQKKISEKKIDSHNKLCDHFLKMSIKKKSNAFAVAGNILFFKKGNINNSFDSSIFSLSNSNDYQPHKELKRFRINRSLKYKFSKHINMLLNALTIKHLK